MSAMFFSRSSLVSTLLALSSSLFALACSEDRCALIECAVAGAVCSPDDGMCHCGSADGAVCGDGEYCYAETETCSDVPLPVCGAGTRWEPGERAFEESTSWGLEGVTGNRIEAIDYDGDGWTDLLVRKIPAAFDDFAAGGARQTWLLRNTGEGRFEDVTEASGLLTPRGGASGGRPVEVVAWGDVDGDGDLDAYLGMNTVDVAGLNQGETSEIMIQDAPGHFVVGPDSAIRFVDQVDAPAGATFVDYDLDGDLDLWVGQHNYTSPGGTTYFRQDRLWRNDGTGGFEDVTIEAGLETEEWRDFAALDEARSHSRAWSSAACDLNDDGLPELLVASYGRAPNHLWQARREGGAITFSNESIASGYAFDENQSWEDNQFARCFCQGNPTAEGCAGVPAPTVLCSPNWAHDNDRHPFRLGGNSGSTICSDLDNDGDIDLLTTEIRHWWAGEGADHAELLVNRGEADARFHRPGREATGLVVPHADPTEWDEGLITATIFDFDLDGWTDVWLGGSEYPGNHGLLYHQDGPLQLREVPITDGIDQHRAQGGAVADFDRDGDLDFLVGHSRSRCGAPDDCYETTQVRMFENRAGDGGNWAQLRLEGAGSATVNGSAIGARVSVTAGGITQTREVEGGHGHDGEQGDLVLTFGLGTACEADVSVRWPDATLTTETFRVSSGHRFRVRPGVPPTLDD